MSSVENSITTFVVLNSITNSLDDVKYDSSSSFTFIEFLKYARDADDNDITFNQYVSYLKNWNTLNVSKQGSVTDDIKSQFLNLFTEIRLKHTSTEEKRYISNIDIENEENLEIVIPFFARKIKEICLYYSEKRVTSNKHIYNISQKGNTESIHTSLKDYIVDLLSNSDDDLYFTSTKNISAIINDINIEVERQYDTFNDYYDLDPNKLPEFYSASDKRSEYFTSNTNTLKADYFYDEEHAIRQLIADKGVTLKELAGLLINVYTADISYLDSSDTEDYKTPASNNLKYNLFIDFYKGYSGTNTHYISTNNVASYVTGELFDTTHPHRNLFNVNYTSTLTIPDKNSKNEKDIGLFFKPTYQGVVKMESKFDYAIDETSLSANAEYIFPDPSRYGRVSNLSKTLIDLPIIYTLDNKSTKRNISSSQGQHAVRAYNRNQRFYSYSSTEQKTTTPQYNGKYKNIQTLVNEGSIFSKETDIYGNVFVSMSNDNYYLQNINGYSFTGGKPAAINFNNTTTQYQTLSTSNKSAINSKQLNIKDFYVVDIITNEINDIEYSLSDVFLKYSSSTNTAYSQLLSGIIDFSVFGNVFFARTSNYVIIDSFAYVDGVFEQSSNIPVIKYYNKSPDVGTNIVDISTPYRVDDFLYFVRLETRNNINSKYLVIDVFRYDLKTKKLANILSQNNIYSSFYEDNFTFEDITTNIVKIRQSRLTYNSRSRVFTLLSNLVDLNYLPLVFILNFKAIDNSFEIHDNVYLKPDNSFITENFYTEGLLTSDFITQPLNGGQVTQNSINGTISL